MNLLKTNTSKNSTTKIKKIVLNNTQESCKNVILNRIYLISKEYNISLIDSIIEYSIKTDTELEELIEIIKNDNNFINIIKKEAQELHYLEKDKIKSLF